MTPIHEILSGWLAAAGLNPGQVAAKLPSKQAGKDRMSTWGLKLYLRGTATPPGEVIRLIGEVCGRDRLEVAAAVLQAAGDLVTAGELRARPGPPPVEGPLQVEGVRDLTITLPRSGWRFVRVVDAWGEDLAVLYAGEGAP